MTRYRTSLMFGCSLALSAAAAMAHPVLEIEDFELGVVPSNQRFSHTLSGQGFPVPVFEVTTDALSGALPGKWLHLTNTRDDITWDVSDIAGGQSYHVTVLVRDESLAPGQARVIFHGLFAEVEVPVPATGSIFQLEATNDTQDENGRSLGPLTGVTLIGPNAYFDDVAVDIVHRHCICDFDQSGAVGVSDLFQFLDAWFALDESSDFDGSGDWGVADLFQFLDCWFAPATFDPRSCG
ncbi:MAG TPA: hypothetical protein PL072_04685 [Phycisphaerales bacterium]|nr:hypothetical protein [Phycisphaerales bacterium]